MHTINLHFLPKALFFRILLLGTTDLQPFSEMSCDTVDPMRLLTFGFVLIWRSKERDHLKSITSLLGSSTYELFVYASVHDLGM